MINNARPLNIMKMGIVGAGAISHAYSQAIQGMDDVELVAVADINPEAAKKLSQPHNAVCYEHHQQMYEGTKELDAVLVSTPPVAHPDICNWLSNHGVNVLCEKPLAIDSESARGMIETAQKNDTVFSMASKFRFVDDMITAKQLVDDGALGEIVLFENAFTGQVDMTQRWNSNPEISGGGVLIDNGTHSLDIMRYFLGPLAELRVVEGKRIQRIPVEDTVHIFVRSENGAVGNIDLSWSINKELPNYLSLYGSKATLHCGWRESKIRYAGAKDWEIFGSGYDKIQAFQSQLRSFHAAIRGEQASLVSHEESLASVRAVEAAYESLCANASNWEPIATV